MQEKVAAAVGVLRGLSRVVTRRIQKRVSPRKAVAVVRNTMLLPKGARPRKMLINVDRVVVEVATRKEGLLQRREMDVAIVVEGANLNKAKARVVEKVGASIKRRKSP
jgi:hypothetical protein